jgi:uncharacterized membrane protein (UPF0127 family)
MNKKIVISFGLVVVFLIVGFFLINHPSNLAPNDFQNIKYVKIAGQNIKVDLALTPAEQEQGLSSRTTLAEDSGMLFVFDRPGQYPFWMKDMNFPIDIIWLAPSGGGDDREAKVVYIKKDARPELFPETYGSSNDAKYVLEVVSGFSDKNNLKEGDSVLFTR